MFFDFAEKKLAAVKSSGQTVSGRDVTHVASFRREVIREFMSLKGSGRCAHCQSYTPNLRKDGASKIFLLPLTEKAEKAMHMMGKTVPNVLDSDDGAVENRAELDAARLDANLAAKQKKKDKQRGNKRQDPKKQAKAKQRRGASDDEYA